MKLALSIAVALSGAFAQARSIQTMQQLVEQSQQFQLMKRQNEAGSIRVNCHDYETVKTVDLGSLISSSTAKMILVMATCDRVASDPLDGDSSIFKIAVIIEQLTMTGSTPQVINVVQSVTQLSVPQPD